jgi:hypothetical protein
MNKDQILQAIMFIMPQAKWRFDAKDFENITYENLVWEDLFYPKPSKSMLKEAYENSTKTRDYDYRIKRSSHYPTPEAQLEIIFDIGIDGWREYIQNVKRNIPKP